MSEHTSSDATPVPFTGRDVLYREKGVSALDVQRAADALLRRGQKPSIATVREQLGGGSPNTLAPLLEQYWKALGSRVAAGPEALERVPESLARMTEALWLRSIDEARQRAKASLAGTTPSDRDRLALEAKLTELTAALAASRARASELELQLLASLRDGRDLRMQVRALTALLKAEQALRTHDQRDGADNLDEFESNGAAHLLRKRRAPLGRSRGPSATRSPKRGEGKPAIPRRLKASAAGDTKRRTGVSSRRGRRPRR